MWLTKSVANPSSKLNTGLTNLNILAYKLGKTTPTILFQSTPNHPLPVPVTSPSTAGYRYIQQVANAHIVGTKGFTRLKRPMRDARGVFFETRRKVAWIQ